MHKGLSKNVMITFTNKPLHFKNDQKRFLRSFKNISLFQMKINIAQRAIKDVMITFIYKVLHYKNNCEKLLRHFKNIILSFNWGNRMLQKLKRVLLLSPKAYNSCKKIIRSFKNASFKSICKGISKTVMITFTKSPFIIRMIVRGS